MKFSDKAVAVGGEAMFGMVGAESDSSDAPMARSSMEWTAKTSIDASTLAICNRWVMKETPTSPISAQRPTRKDIVNITSPGEM